MLIPPPISTLLPNPFLFFFFFKNTPPTEISPLPLHAALPISSHQPRRATTPRASNRLRPLREPPDPKQRMTQTWRSTPRAPRARSCTIQSSSRIQPARNGKIGRAHV